jgi:3-phenylpropionate/trans-cinnamate dioxygenase ferredoxin reductase component
VQAVRGADERVTAVELTDGSVLPADVVLVAIGSTLNTGWLATSGLSLTDGVDCDAYCRAGTDIVAAGDVASWEYPGFGQRMRLEHQTNALEQGAAAARSLIGGDAEEFAPVPFFSTSTTSRSRSTAGHTRMRRRRSCGATRRRAGLPRHTGTTVGLVAVLTWNMPP